MDRPALPPSRSEILRSGHGVRCREAAFPGPARQWGPCPQGTLLPQDAAPVRPQSWWPRPWETTVPTGRTAFSFPPPARDSTRTRYLTPKSHSALASTVAALNPPSGRAVAMGPPYLQVPRSKLHGKPGRDGPSCMSVTLCARRTNHQHLDPEAGPRPPRRQPPPPRWLPPLPRPLPAQATRTAPLFPSPAAGDTGASSGSVGPRCRRPPQRHEPAAPRGPPALVHPGLGPPASPSPFRVFL